MQSYVKNTLIILLIILMGAVCSSESEGPSIEEVRQGRMKWIELNRRDAYEIQHTAATRNEAISNYLIDLIESREGRRILSRDEYLAAFWANQPDERIMDLGKSPLMAFQIEDTDRRFGRHYIKEKLKGSTTCSIRNIETLKSETTGSVIFHSIGRVDLDCDRSGPITLTQIAVVIEHQGRFKVASLKPR